MNLFRPFRTRSVSRDEETDRARFESLSAAIAIFHTEVTREREGLQNRYKKTQADAGFTQQALDGEPDDEKLARRLDRQTDALLQAEARLRALDAQAELIKKIEGLIVGSR